MYDNENDLDKFYGKNRSPGEKKSSARTDIFEKINKIRNKKDSTPATINEQPDESAIFYDGIFYGQVPIDLLRDPTMKLQAKAVFALMHSYSQPKKLEANPKTYVSQARLAKDVGMSVDRLRGWMKKLEDSGWLTTKRRGLNKSNNYILHARKKKKR